MDEDDALLRLHHAGGQAAWLRQLLSAAALEAADHPALAALQASDAVWQAAGAPPTARSQARHAAAGAYSAQARRWRDGAASRQILGWGSTGYPSLLSNTDSPPVLLFCEGQSERLWWPQIAVVGSRAPTPAGRERATRWARAFADAGFVVTSGMASGIDAAAHAACLAAPGSIAVMASGPDRCYPPGHAELKTALAEQGCVVSEHPPGTPPRQAHFPRRNRIIAGLALATVVIEAAQRSGALITARWAAEAGREVFALPGAPENPKARGCHRLIRDGAQLADDPAQVIEAVLSGSRQLARSLAERLRPDSPPLPAAAADRDPGPIPQDPQGLLVWQALGDAGASFDELLLRSGLTPETLAPILLAMELDGRLCPLHGRYLPCTSFPPTGSVLSHGRTG